MRALKNKDIDNLNTERKIRKSNFELLRIIAMFLILFHHFYYNNFNFDYSNITISQFIVQFLSSFGKVGVCIFILITGYFSVESKFKLKKLFKLIGETLFYSWIFLWIYLLFINKDITRQELIRCLFPISQNEYWFITTYIVLYLLSDYINILVKALSKKQMQILIGVLFVIWSLLPSLTFFTKIFSTKFEFSNLDWFILMYLIGAYLKRFPLEKLTINKSIFLLVICLMLNILSILFLNKYFYKLKINPLDYSWTMNLLISLFTSILIFNIFSKINVKSKFINKISTGVFGVYLIHTQILMRNVIWFKIFNITKYADTAKIVIYEIFVVVAIFIICTIIDFIRQFTIEKIYMRLIEKLELKLKKS